MSRKMDRRGLKIVKPQKVTFVSLVTRYVSDSKSLCVSWKVWGPTESTDLSASGTGGY